MFGVGLKQTEAGSRVDAKQSLIFGLIQSEIARFLELLWSDSKPLNVNA